LSQERDDRGFQKSRKEKKKKYRADYDRSAFEADPFSFAIVLKYKRVD
jgi:hypothetical protein